MDIVSLLWFGSVVWLMACTFSFALAKAQVKKPYVITAFGPAVFFIFCFIVALISEGIRSTLFG